MFFHCLEELWVIQVVIGDACFNLEQGRQVDWFSAEVSLGVIGIIVVIEIKLMNNLAEGRIQDKKQGPKNQPLWDPLSDYSGGIWVTNNINELFPVCQVQWRPAQGGTLNAWVLITCGIFWVYMDMIQERGRVQGDWAPAGWCYHSPCLAITSTCNAQQCQHRKKTGTITSTPITVMHKGICSNHK